MNIIALLFKKVVAPPRFKYIKQYLGRDNKLSVLDVGCGSRSCELTKQWLDIDIYHGVDKEVWQDDAQSYVGIDKLFEIDLDHSSLDEIPDDAYDVIVVSHLIEHLGNALPVLEALTSKLRKDGVLYIETPSVRTINFPSAIGFLNFYDDPTHRRVYFDSEIIPLLQRCGMKVCYAGYRRDWLRILLLAPASLLLNVIFFIPFKRRFCAWGLWDALGVAQVWVGKKLSLEVSL